MPDIVFFRFCDVGGGALASVRADQGCQRETVRACGRREDAADGPDAVPQDEGKKK